MINNQDGLPPQEMEGGETFFQRMKRLNGQQQAAAAGQPQGTGNQAPPQPQQPTYTPPNNSGVTGGSNYASQINKPAAPQAQPATPVTGNGKIPPPAPAPAPQPPAAPAPQGADPNATFQAMSARIAALQAGQPDPMTGVVPPGAHATAAVAAPGQVQLPAGLPQRPGSTNVTGVDLGPGFQGSYSGSTFTQFHNPNNPALESGQANLAQAILGNPESMSPDVVNAMKNAGKENALMQAKQAAMRGAASAAARGVSGGGGEQAFERRAYDAADSNILANNRDIDVNAAQTNFGNKLQALSAVDQILNSGMGRATSAYDATTRGQGLQADENFRKFGADQATATAADQHKLSQFGINQAVAGNALDNYKTDSSNYFGGRDADRADKSLALQKTLGEGGLSLDQARLNSQNSQFDKGYGLDIMRFLEGKRQADNSLGYNYNALTQNGQNAMVQSILQMIGK